MTGRIQQIMAGLLFSAIVMASAAAQVYKWTDEQGRVHYGDRPPGQGAHSVDVDPGPASPATAPDDTERRDKTRRLLRAYDEERRIKQQREQRQEAEAAERRKRCTQARDRLRQYRQAGGLYELDEQGERRYLDSSRRQQAEARAEQDVRQWCD